MDLLVHGEVHKPYLDFWVWDEQEWNRYRPTNACVKMFTIQEIHSNLRMLHLLGVRASSLNEIGLFFILECVWKEKISVLNVEILLRWFILLYMNIFWEYKTYCEQQRFTIKFEVFRQLFIKALTGMIQSIRVNILEC